MFAKENGLPPDNSGDDRDAAPACELCEQQAAGADVPITWMTSVENGRRLVYCDRCARENVRSIEGKLDSAWW